MAPRVVAHPGTRPTEELRTVDEQHSTAPDPHPSTDEHPHGCYEGFVYLGFEGEDENGEHVEEIERVPCRRCQQGGER